MAVDETAMVSAWDSHGAVAVAWRRPKDVTMDKVLSARNTTGLDSKVYYLEYVERRISAKNPKIGASRVLSSGTRRPGRGGGAGSGKILGVKLIGAHTLGTVILADA